MTVTSSLIPLDPLQAAESKPPPKAVKKESKKEKKEMSLLDLDDCEQFFSSPGAACSIFKSQQGLQ